MNRTGVYTGLFAPCIKLTKNSVSDFNIKYRRTLSWLTSNIRSCGCVADDQRKRKDCTLQSMAQYKRHFHVSKINCDNERKVQTKVITFTNPFTYISLRVKLFLMTVYFDREFNEDQFISGAKQAVVYVSSCLSDGKFNELNEVLTADGMESSRNLYFNSEQKSSSLRVDETDFLNISMKDIGFEYGDEGRKWAYVLVVCVCTAKEVVTKTFGNIDIIATPTRILKYSFRREYTSGIDSSWLIDRLEHSK